MSPILGYDYIILDCDGVIFDSNTRKVALFIEALSESSAVSFDSVRCERYFEINFGKSIEQHINFLVEKKFINILKGYDSSSTIEGIVLSYINKIEDLYLDVDYVPGFLDFLNIYKGDLSVLTGGREVILTSSLEQLEILSRFSVVSGAPGSKKDRLTNVLGKFDSSATGLFVGDSLIDLDCAKSAGLDFLALWGCALDPSTFLSKAVGCARFVARDWAEVVLHE